MRIVKFDLDEFWKDKDDKLYEIAKAGSMEELQARISQYIDDAIVED